MKTLKATIATLIIIFACKANLLAEEPTTPSTTPVLGDPNPNQQGPNEAWQAKVKIGDTEYTSVYVFLTHGVMIELQLKPNQRPSISPGFYKLTKSGKLEIEWTKIRNHKLVITSNEEGRVKKVGRDQLKYKISKHTDNRQVGLEISFRRVSVNKEEYAQMLRLADTYHRLKIQQISNQREIDYWNEKLRSYENALKALVNQ